MDGFTLTDAATLCREKADWLKGVPYPPSGASGAAGEKEAFLRACILDVCSAEPEDREDVAENAGDQDPSDPPVPPSTTTTTTTTSTSTTTTTTTPAVVGDELYVFGFTPYVGSSSPYMPEGVVEVESLPDGNTPFLEPHRPRPGLQQDLQERQLLWSRHLRRRESGRPAVDSECSARCR